ncbi:MAG: site-specific DNA-methyltransferase [bacterium]|nr:site-specific DNA-methyltransferase [bacterium]
MTKRNYKGSLRLDWINKDLSLYYEIDEKEGKGVRPVWVKKNDIRVAEPRILRFAKSYGEATSENMLIKGDNLLVLRSLVEMFKGKQEEERVKCIYIDPPFNTGNAFKYYDDNLQHSEWLTMMRDRLYLLRKLLKKNGVIFTHIDEQEQAYLKVLLDEIFGRDNYLTTITVKSKTPSGVGQESHIFSITEFIHVYAKDKKVAEKFNYKIDDEVVDEKSRTSKNYNIQIKDYGENIFFKELKTGKGNSIKVYKVKDFKTQKQPQASRTQEWYFKNYDRIFRLSPANGGLMKKITPLLPKGDCCIEYSPTKGKYANQSIKIYFVNRDMVVMLNESVRIDKRSKSVIKTVNVHNNWTDESLWQGISREGGVEFKNSKKPEKLIQRILEMTTNTGELVLDSFAGSGTTGAVAHKLGRRWVMVEIGKHAEELIISRMQKVVSGKDQSGISKEVNWKGGGGFKYYQLGDSIIHEQDMNWKLKAEEIAEAVFLHFQYRPIKMEWLEKENMYLGRHQSARYHFALSFASREIKTISEDLYEKIVIGLDKEKFKHLTIFTNVAVSVSPESLDDRVLVKKIPAAILREYNLI